MEILGSESDIDDDFSSGSDSDFNPMAVEEVGYVDETNDLDAEFMNGLEVFETEKEKNSFSLKCRKRVRNGGNWARNDRKKKRNM